MHGYNTTEFPHRKQVGNVRLPATDCEPSFPRSCGGSNGTTCPDVRKHPAKAAGGGWIRLISQSPPVVFSWRGEPWRCAGWRCGRGVLRFPPATSSGIRYTRSPCVHVSVLCDHLAVFMLSRRAESSVNTFLRRLWGRPVRLTRRAAIARVWQRRARYSERRRGRRGLFR